MRIKSGSKHYRRETDNTRSAGSDNSDSPRSGPGALRGDANDPNDYIFEKLALGADARDASPTEYIDLRGYSKPSRHQNRRGTCAAFTMATIREIQEHMSAGVSGLVPAVLSPEFIYHHRKNKPSEGMFARDAFAIMREIGTVPEEMFPYAEHDFAASDPTQEHYDIAYEHKFTNYARVLTCAGLKRAIREVGPCYLVLPLYDSRPIFWRRRNNQPGDSHGHSLAVVGYDAHGFILKNSWGPQWNGDGCITFPYADWDHHWECWAPLNRDVVVPENTHMVQLERSNDPLVRETKHKNKCTIS